jgi:hypothetical protein
MQLNRSRWGAVVLAIVVCCNGCGSEDSLDRASGRSMQSAAQSGAADRAQNSTPRINALHFEPDTPRTGDKVRVVVEASDDDGDHLSYTFQWTINGIRLTEQNATIKLSGARRGEPVKVEVVASDGLASSEPLEATTRVHNRPPHLTGVRLESNSSISAGTEVTARPTARDLDGDTPSYRYSWWVNGRAELESGPKFSTAGLHRGDTLRVRVFASDGQDESNSVDSEEIVLGNAPPIIVSQPGGADEDGTFRYQVRAEDEDDDDLLISLVKGPKGMAMTSAGGLIEWSPRPDQGGTHVIDVAVDDSFGARTTQRFSIVVDPGAASAPPAAPASDQD